MQTFVGNTFERRDPLLQGEVRRKVLDHIVAESLPAPSPPAPGPRHHLPVTHPPTTAEEFDSLLQSMRRGPLEELSAVSRRMASAVPALWPPIATVLLAERSTPQGDYEAVLDTIGGDVPDRHGHFPRSWKRRHGYRVKLSSDWFEDLLALPPAMISSRLSDVYRDCVVQATLLRAATAIGQTSRERASEVVPVVLDVAYAHRGTFRDEAGRALAGLGDIAIPALVRASVRPDAVEDRADRGADRRARFATFVLEQMDRRHPVRAITALADDPPLLAELLAAYGEARPPDAAAALVEHLDAPDPGVRAAAAKAVAAYLQGSAPEVRRRDVRLLGGAVTRAPAFLTYRERAEQALDEAIARADWPPDELSELSSSDRLQRYLGWIVRRRDEQLTASIEEALALDDLGARTDALDELLANHPEFPRNASISGVFASFGRELEAADDHGRAAVQYRKAGMLAEDPELARRLRVAALLNEARVEGLADSGRRMLLRTAGALAPDLPRLTRWFDDAREHADRPGHAAPPWFRVWMIGSAGLALLFGLWARVRRPQLGGGGSLSSL